MFPGSQKEPVSRFADQPQHRHGLHSGHSALFFAKDYLKDYYRITMPALECEAPAGITAPVHSCLGGNQPENSVGDVNLYGADVDGASH